MRIQTRQFATLVILLTSLLLSPVTLMAQATADWSRLTSISTGSKLSVKLKNGNKVDGKLSSVSDTAVTLMVKNTSTELKRDDIRTIHQVGGKSAKKGALIGLGVGAGAGAVVGGVLDASNDDSFEDFDAIATGVTTVIGAGVGAGLGALGGFLLGRTGKKRVLLYEAK